jgi:hypothetical protein
MGTRPFPFPQGIVLAALFLGTFLLQVLSPVTTSTDSAWTLHLATSILRERNIDLDEYRNLIDLQLDYRLRVVRGHIYYYYPVATPLLVAPAVALANLIYPLNHPTDLYTYLGTHGPDARTARLEKLLASGFVALAAAVMYLIARTRLPSLGAAAIALIFAFSTSMWSTASRALWQHGPSAMFLALALYLTLVASGRRLAILCIGFLLGYAYIIRPTNSLSVVFVGLFVLVNRPRAFWLYVSGALLVLLPYCAQNWLTYGNVFPPYSYQLFERLGTPAAIGEALVGTLFSPGRGLFIFTPFLLFTVFAAFRSVRNQALPFASIEVYLIAIVLAHWLTTSLFEDWAGAWSIGPRYFVDVLPYLMYLLIPIFQMPLVATAAARYAFVAAVAVSTLIQWHCSASIYPFMWNGKPKALVEAPGRKWDWGDLQFLRGTCKNNPLEGRAPACWFERGD